MSSDRESDPLVTPASASAEQAPAGGMTDAGETGSAGGAGTAGGAGSAGAASDRGGAVEAGGSRRARRRSANMLPQRDRRSWPERLLVRVIATCGIVGIGVAIAAIMHSSDSEGWLIGLVVSIVSVMLAALLWSSRVL